MCGASWVGRSLRRFSLFVPPVLYFRAQFSVSIVFRMSAIFIVSAFVVLCFVSDKRTIDTHLSCVYRLIDSLPKILYFVPRFSARLNVLRCFRAEISFEDNRQTVCPTSEICTAEPIFPPEF
jgi:hypothetical protein